MAGWAPLVYARTLKVDFRLLAIPQDVPASDLEWFRECVEGSTVYPDELREDSRVSLFRTPDYCAFGVTCMAGLLSSRNTRVGNRELYLFAGYVTRAPQQYSATAACAAIPSLSGVKRGAFRVFRPLYQHVNRLWNDERPALSDGELNDLRHGWQDNAELQRLTSEHMIDPRVVADAWTINRSPSVVRMFPESDVDRMWSEAVLTSEQTSLCVGLPNVTAAKRSPFLNAGVLSLKTQRDESRDDAQPQERPDENDATSQIEAPPEASESSGGFSRLVGSLFRKPTPLEPLPDDLSDDSPADSTSFVRRWDQDEDPDGWIEH